MEQTGVVTMKGNALTLVGPALKVGDKAPAFTVLDSGLAPKTLEDFKGKIKVISVGGEYFERYGAFLGAITISNILGFHADICFHSCAAFQEGERA